MDERQVGRMELRDLVRAYMRGEEVESIYVHEIVREVIEWHINDEVEDEAERDVLKGVGWVKWIPRKRLREHIRRANEDGCDYCKENPGADSLSYCLCGSQFCRDCESEHPEH